MIESFGDDASADLYHGRNTHRVRRFPPEIKRIALRKLDMLNAAYRINDLREPPGNRLEALKGEMSGYHSIRVNDQFLAPAGITQVAFANHIGVPLQRINEIVRGKRGITPETAWLFSQALGTTPQFWMNLQNAYDLSNKRPGRTVKRLIKAS